ncbi:MAG: hypothetical protein GW779_00680 [Candidatus Altiarchaeum hamiconexum]|uniref:Imidazoleglycerol-phosphate dehydratase n=1 Tax=Candidatus Altarchaeum hamiconexum TaxID=1803513 RepID=A0A8J8CJ87_9ARCH|nr:hypothetical protein [Candidatus Altarchaeum hamiconexum]OIQ05527.1 MAG: hypothetical protein AUK59_03520 [Candidatus Altarchaeum sp. CG2_30_32_3053]PIN66897.1 MAG: hypothetical protein COV98_05785 [Candidatus Altarchaeum sp. CG12_big_fil_rev_8_21_14_0_65_33_22]PIV27644.1 MAG: hypothetical protein COS36_05120 [Candidatus Altarchaeum sp. CG03_land_8_20_14_0_80_32_618]PIX48258.1 MAG: hypothetical protein COZ53_04700 [Candidatus Altarchaeum sp. CG_4_8_14_3_um_filter_33_2054]PIZ32563.1 MAG: hyp
MEYGIKINRKDDVVAVERTTKESIITVQIQERRNANPVLNVRTGINFLNHMIETLAFRSEFNMDADVRTEINFLKHVVAEDTGIVIGTAFFKIFEEKIQKGIRGNGFFSAVIDESQAMVSVSVEGRPNLYFDKISNGLRFDDVEDIPSADLKNFLSGFALGMKATLHICSEFGEDPHHAWESVFRALGEAIKEMFENDEKRKNLITGVKGTIE